MIVVLRGIAGVLIGLIVAFVLVVALELFSAVVHPFPEGVEQTMEEICRHVEKYPQWILAVAVAAWAFTAFLSTWIAKKIGNLYSALIVGLLLLAALVMNLSKLPYPIWFKGANLIAIPGAIAAGLQLSNRQKIAAKASFSRDDLI
jgi:hypothetical protein